MGKLRLTQLTKCLIWLRTLFGDYGEVRDRWIARSRVVLNIHFYDIKVAEQVRLSYLLNNGVLRVVGGVRIGRLRRGNSQRLP